eukprot:2673144-Amphidinium_carterae.1
MGVGVLRNPPRGINKTRKGLAEVAMRGRIEEGVDEIGVRAMRGRIEEGVDEVGVRGRIEEEL